MNTPARQSAYITLALVAYNEERHLDDCFATILAQTYPKERIELVIVNNASTDRTLELMHEFARAHQHEYHRIAILDNNERPVPQGVNKSLALAEGELFVRIDAHATLDADFIEKSVAAIERGHDVVGGMRPTFTKDKSAFGAMLHAAEESLFGSSIAAYRRSSNSLKEHAVDSVFHGLYRMSVYDTVGIYDERLHRAEDNDMSYRIRQHGYTIWFDPAIVSHQHIRSSLSRMIKQKFSNGFWMGKTLFAQPGCVSTFHLVPFAFVLTLIASIIVAIFWCKWMLITLLGLYALACIVMTITAALSAKKLYATFLLLPFVFFALHTAYGLGTLKGLLPPWLAKVKDHPTRQVYRSTIDTTQLTEYYKTGSA